MLAKTVTQQIRREEGRGQDGLDYKGTRGLLRDDEVFHIFDDMTIFIHQNSQNYTQQHECMSTEKTTLPRLPVTFRIKSKAFHKVLITPSLSLLRSSSRPVLPRPLGCSADERHANSFWSNNLISLPQGGTTSCTTG